MPEPIFVINVPSNLNQLEPVPTDHALLALLLRRNGDAMCGR